MTSLLCFPRSDVMPLLMATPWSPHPGFPSVTRHILWTLTQPHVWPKSNYILQALLQILEICICKLLKGYLHKMCKCFGTHSHVFFLLAPTPVHKLSEGVREVTSHGEVVVFMNKNNFWAQPINHPSFFQKTIFSSIFLCWQTKDRKFSFNFSFL